MVTRFHLEHCPLNHRNQNYTSTFNSYFRIGTRLDFYRSPRSGARFSNVPITARKAVVIYIQLLFTFNRFVDNHDETVSKQSKMEWFVNSKRRGFFFRVPAAKIRSIKPEFLPSPESQPKNFLGSLRLEKTAEIQARICSLKRL